MGGGRQPKDEIHIAQELYLGQQGAPVKAVEGYRSVFVGWSDGVKSNPRIDVANKNDIEKGTREVFAEFRPMGVWQRLKMWIKKLIKRR